MDPTQKLCSAVGFAMKAGKLQTGDFAVEKLARAGKARMVLLDCGVSKNTREKYERLCVGKQLPLAFIPHLGESIGKPGRMLAAVTDENFSRIIQSAVACVCADDSNDRG